MGTTAQNSNPWSGTGSRGAMAGASPNVPMYGPDAGRFSNPGQIQNPWTNYQPTRGPAGTMGGGTPPPGPSTTMPGSFDPTIGMETGGPYNPMVGTRTPSGPPTLGQATGGGFNPMTRTNPAQQPGSMNSSFGGVGQAYTGPSGGGSMTGQNTQQGAGQVPMNSGPGRYFGQRQAAGDQPVDDQGYVKSLYSGLLGRDPSTDEVSNASQALTGQYGGNRGALADFFKNSAEYKARAPQSQPNAYSGAGSGLPFDPRTPGYQMNPRVGSSGWQETLRQHAMGAGQNPNQYIQDRGLSPLWADQRQGWEPQSFPPGMGLSEILQRTRGY